MNGKNSTPLVVYKASAGSGKTFRLAVEYIKLLVDNPESYKHILAVTFTNKATEEMKMRILSQLYGIAKGLPSSDKYVTAIKQSLTIDDTILRAKAGQALKNLLHNYSYFHVETIDSFFQTVLKNLARELDLSPNLKIDLNDTKVKNDAVDILIKELDNDEATLQQIMKFVEENIAKDKGWNVINKIKDFGNTIFKDFYKENSDEINLSITKVPELKEKLNSIVSEFEEQMKQFAHDFDRYFGNEEIKGKNNIRNYYKNIQDGKFRNKDLVKNYLTKVLEDENAIAHELTVRCEEYRNAHICEYLSAVAVLPYLNQLTLLQKIENKIRVLNNDANRFLLSDTQNILMKIIDGSDAPFIYEKIGTRISHIMIDEFQDTSMIQWKNFKVLLDDCMARAEKLSLIVGDVKQSIYRWRSGDWRLLHHIQEQYDKKSIQIKSLNTNYRSEQNIVTFNNAFFKNAIQLTSDDIQQAYKDIEQTANKQDGKGYVRISFVEGDEENSNEDVQLQKIYDTITELKAQGAEEKDITLLLRTNGKIALIAQWFAENHPEIKIISDEAFKLSASVAVCIMMNAFTYLIQKDDISLAYLTKHRKEQVEIFLQQQEELLSLPLYDMAERFFSIFALDTMQDENAFLCAFFDYLLDFVKNNPADIRLFLKEWENNICEKNIQVDEVEGIRIMTIHKSKGLEFDNVIMPFCDWKTGKTSLLWVKTDGKKLVEDIPIVPVNCSSFLTETIFCKAYEEESMQNTVDDLNMLYVAFTRASKNLFVICKKKYKTDEITSTINSAIQGISFMTHTDDEYEYGTITASRKVDEHEDDDNIFSQQPETKHIDVTNSAFIPEFRESNASNYFNKEEESEGEKPNDDNMRQKGILLHNLLSEIEYLNDADRVLDRYAIEGLFGQDISRQEAEKVIKTIKENKLLSEWFSDSWKVFNEREIIKKNHAEEGSAIKHRCDRVIYNDNETIVIDFKFGIPEKRYIRQVREYITLLQQIGFKNVKGYLWYASTDTLEPVG
ncbi:MAG: UvrD-helicase domain-containing protein [Prevotella sp.]|nr:UvrD-helicase domain-containing protein [Candidatus Equicola stercoris]